MLLANPTEPMPAITYTQYNKIMKCEFVSECTSILFKYSII